MTRLLKVITLTGVSSVYLMQAPCTTLEHGFSIVPNGLIPNPFTALTSSLSSLISSLTT